MLLRASRLVVLALLVATALPAQGEAQRLALDALTSTELGEQLRSGRTTILIPIGGTEQNGPHMALGKHNRRVALLAEKIAASLGDALVAPVVAYVPEGDIDPPTAHMRFPGTITVASEPFMRTLESAANSFRSHGFRHIVFLGDHGGYQQDLRRVAERLNRAWRATNARAHALPEFYQSAAVAYPALLRQRGYSDAEIGLHAGLADTSLMLALDPTLVRPDRLAAPVPPPATGGVAGDPRRSSAEAGQLGVDLIVARTVEAIRRAASPP